MNHIYRIMLGAMMSYGLAQGQSINVNKLFHHSGINTTEPSVELGSVVLYVDHYPNPKKIIKTVSKHKDKTQKSFFLPEVEIKTAEVKEAMDRINKNNNLPYSVMITPMSGAQKGLKIVVTYNDQEIGVKRKYFDSVSLHKSIEFCFYNKALLSKIKNNTKPITQVACHTPPKVIIDCGHGGTDMGAVGYNGITEKNINLQVGLCVAQLLKKKNINVCLTRESDQTMLLDERTTFANQHMADLFISIHANAAPNKHSCGIETYCLSDALFKDEEADGEENDMAACLLRQHLGNKYAKSQKLAHTIHQSVLSTIPARYGVKDRRVKHNVAQVLLGTTMPAVLIEIGYVTHEQEAQLLAQEQYQSFIAQGIVQGIDAYLARSV